MVNKGSEKGSAPAKHAISDSDNDEEATHPKKQKVPFADLNAGAAAAATNGC